MINLIGDIKIIEKFREDMRGVFTLSDLKGILPCEHPNTLYRAITNLEKNGILKRLSRGIYVADKFDLPAVSQKICPSSYISFETVLAKHLIIGTVPKYEVKAIKVGKRREYKSDFGNILQLGIARHLYFGFETVGGINFADKEKALLDTLYFYCKGLKFFFDIYSDMNLSVIDRKKINEYLTRYKNPKFLKFVAQFFKTGGL